MKKKIGLIINPVAGIGGAVGLKGSDGKEIQKTAFERGAVAHSQERTKTALKILCNRQQDIIVYAAPSNMGENLAKEMGFAVVVVGKTEDLTTAEDTERIAAEMKALQIDVLVFAGGDGTARNIYNAISDTLPVIGIPAGVKIHSAVYGMNPEASGKALLACLGNKINTKDGEVMDIDEESYRAGVLKAKLFGYMKVPIVGGVMQNAKAASHNSDNDVSGICYEIADRIKNEDADTCYILGAGSTVMALKKHLGMEGTLIGVDAYQNDKTIGIDLREQQILKITNEKKCKLIITAIGGQGHIFGRGNQQISSAVIKSIGVENIWIVATGSKIYSLPEQTLYVDTGDTDLDGQLRGYQRVIVGWQENLVCQVK